MVGKIKELAEYIRYIIGNEIPFDIIVTEIIENTPLTYYSQSLPIQEE